MSEQGSNYVLSEDHRRALAYHHVTAYEKSLQKLGKAQSEIRSTVKRAKAEGVSLDLMKALMDLDTPEGEAKIKEQMHMLLQAAGWADSEIGTQFSFEDIPDRSPLTERAYKEGKTSGMKATERKSPYEGDAEQAWLRGYADGQTILMESIDLTKKGLQQIAAEDVAKAEKKAAREADRERKKAEKEAKAAAPPKKRGRKPKAKNGTEPDQNQTGDQGAAAPPFEG